MTSRLPNNHSFHRLSALGLLVGILAGLFASARAEATSCDNLEYAYMVDPVVIVVAGPRDAAEERMRLEDLDYAFLVSSNQISMGQTTFDFEANP